MRPFPPVAVPPLLIALAIATVILIIAPQPCWSQEKPEWVYLDEYPAGTPASVELMEDDSSTQATRLILIIHGFWVEQVIGPDQRTYHRYQFPGLGEISQAGAPELPEMHFRIAVPSTARELTLRTARVLKERIYSDILPYPQPIPEGDEEGRPEEWRYDDKVYSSPQPFPLQTVPETVGLDHFMAFIPSADLVVNPVQWNPERKELRVIVEFDLAYNHEGSVPKYEEMTKHRERMAARLFDNWAVAGKVFPVDTTEYVGSFLFLRPADYADSLQALSDQKRARGFHVTEYSIPKSGNTCESIRNIIRNWYDLVEDRGDAYVMLIGDTDVIPLCQAGTLYNGTVYTEDLYASTVGDDLDEEVFLGRLAVDDEFDLGNQVRKILRYEDEVRWLGEYEDALLIAHHQGAPGKYEGAMEDVRTATYSHPPHFITCYGSEGDDDADIDDAIEKDVGVVAYRGHANEYAWTYWNGYDSYNTTDVGNLSNGAMTPIVWAFTCSSGNIRVQNCLGEVFMMEPEDRGVAYYGATTPSDTNPNHHLTRNLFKRVYDEDFTIQSHAIMMAEEFMTDETYGDNAWMYLLLGDPEMTIRRYPPGRMTMKLPERVTLCDSAPCFLDVQVLDDLGRPIPELIVSAWMPTPPTMAKAETVDRGGVSDFQDLQEATLRQPPVGGVLSNRYSDEEGKAHLPAEPQGEGWILVTARDDFGHVISDVVQVVTSTGTPALRAPLFLSARPAVMSERTTFHFGRALDSTYRLEIYDQRGRLVRRLSGGSGPDHMMWDGRDEAGSAVGSGVYMVRLITEGTRLSTKVVRVR